MVACQRIGIFPSHTSWKEKKYLIKIEMIKLRNDSMKLNVADIENVELSIARYVQHSTYGGIYTKHSADAERYDQIINKLKNLQVKRELKSLSTLCPFFDSFGLLRVRGRLSKIDISYDRKHQIILPKRHHYTNLVVQQYHEEIGHSGPEATLRTTRKKYWIVSGINTVKFYLKTCVICIKKHARATPQFLGDHPPSRVTVF